MMHRYSKSLESFELHHRAALCSTDPTVQTSLALYQRTLSLAARLTTLRALLAAVRWRDRV